MDYIKKKGAVLQAKFLEEWTSKDKKTYYIFGIGIKQGTKPEDSDVGKYYSPIEEQTYFKVGEEVEYMYKKNDKEPKDSRIKPFAEEKKNNPYSGLSVEEYIERKKIDAISFSASYAKDIFIAHPDKSLTQEAEKILRWQLDKLNEL